VADSGLKLIKLCLSKNIPVIALSSDEREDIIPVLDLLLHYAQQTVNLKKADFFKDFFNNHFKTKNLALQEKIKQLWGMPIKDESIHFDGATGTGKSYLAHLLHQSIFGAAPFIHLNCAEIPENLLEAELFGYSKGAFTGADKNYDGKIALAKDGTLFLDEIGTISPNIQAKLLRVFENKSFYPVGSNVLKKINFTLMSATWENLAEKVQRGQFRPDLYQRLINYQLSIPALHQRPDDIKFYINQWKKSYPRHFLLDTSALDLLQGHSWPGNIRELNKVLTQLAQTNKGEVTLQDAQEALALSGSVTNTNTSWTYDHQALQKLGIKKYLLKLEREIVESYLKKEDGQVTSVMEQLKLSPSSFYRINRN